jgi:hypothetical protein
MGGGQANAGQASQAASNANTAVQGNISTANAASGRANSLYNLLFGSGGSGSSGTLSGFMNPASMNVTTPTGAYKTNYEQTIQQIQNQGNNAQKGIIQQAANNGLGLSSPAIAAMARDTGLQTANLTGQAFNNAVTNQQQQAINNFWNATGTAATAAGANNQTAVAGNTGAGSTSSGIYGTAGAYHPPAWTSALGSGLAAGGAIGSAALMPTPPTPAGATPGCAVAGSKILTPRGELEIERLRAGDEICQKGDRVAKLKCAPIPYALANIYRVESFDEKVVLVASEHAFINPKGGYTEAEDLAVGFDLDMLGNDRGRVKSVSRVGTDTVYKIVTCDDNTNRTYCVEGFWSLE